MPLDSSVDTAFFEDLILKTSSMLAPQSRSDQLTYKGLSLLSVRIKTGTSMLAVLHCGRFLLRATAGAS